MIPLEVMALSRAERAHKTLGWWARALTPILSSVRIRLRPVSVWLERGAPRVAHIVADLDELESPPPRHRAA